jgi:hypothetical protein
MKRIKTLNKEVGRALTQMYYSAMNYIEKHQKGKGYINTQNGGNDTMYFYAYTDADNELVEGRICAIRVHNGSIQFLGTIFNNLYLSDEDIEAATKRTEELNNAKNEEISGNWEEVWQDVYGGDIVIYCQTMISICEAIEQYK